LFVGMKIKQMDSYVFSLKSMLQN